MTRCVVDNPHWIHLIMPGLLDMQMNCVEQVNRNDDICSYDSWSVCLHTAMHVDPFKSIIGLSNISRAIIKPEQTGDVTWERAPTGRRCCWSNEAGHYRAVPQDRCWCSWGDSMTPPRPVPCRTLLHPPDRDGQNKETVISLCDTGL